MIVTYGSPNTPVEIAARVGLKHDDEVWWSPEPGVLMRAKVDTRSLGELSAQLAGKFYYVWSPNLVPETEGITWMRGWSEEAERALRAARAL